MKRYARAAVLFLRTLLYLNAHFLMIFLPAGGFGYPQGWAFFAVLAASAAVHLGILAGNPSLEKERTDPGGAVKKWDRLLSPAAQWSVYATIFISAAGRGYAGDIGAFRTAPALIGLTLYAAGSALFLYAMASNEFFSSVSRVQSDRGQTPRESGPYRRVRHPGYAGACLQLAGIPAALGSLAGALPALAGIALFVLKTELEDRMLEEELPGYPEYSSRVRDRLVPGVW